VPVATPSPVPGVTQLPIATKAPAIPAAPIVTLNPRGEVIKSNIFEVPSKIVGKVSSSTLTTANTTLFASTKIPVQAVIKSVKKGTAVTVTVKGKDGVSYKVASTIVKTTGVFKSPVVKFSKPGTYQITVTVGKTKRVVTYKVK
jgi:hypothetical protein